MSDNENIEDRPDEDVEGHRIKMRNVAEDESDVEGHRFKARNVAEDDDDVEGHRWQKPR